MAMMMQFNKGFNLRLIGQDFNTHRAHPIFTTLTAAHGGFYELSLKRDLVI